MMQNIFPYVYLPSVFLLGKISDKVLAYFLIELFVFLLLSLRVLCIFWVIVLYQLSFANIFFQSVTCFLILLTSSFTEQKFFILMKVSLSIASFMDCTFGVISKKLLPYPRSSRFLLWYFIGVL